MPMSAKALDGLGAAVRYNPFMAKELLGILRETPDWVMYKPDDPYGPLGLMFAALPRKRIAPGITVPIQAPPLSEEELAACSVWNAEWLRREFSKRELAEGIAAILEELEGEPTSDHFETPDQDGMLVLYNARRQ